MNFYRLLIKNHVLSYLLFSLVVILGTLTYFELPRQQDPSINFNWIQVIVSMPGASAEELETKVINILEEGIETLEDVKFVSSNSYESYASILIRFNDISDDTFRIRVSDLRRVIDQKSDQLPEQASDPEVIEITSSNAYPTATLILSGDSLSEQLRFQAKRLKREIERNTKVFKADPVGLADPEIQIRYYPQELANYRLDLNAIVQTIQLALKDQSAGDAIDQNQLLLVRVLGIDKTPEAIAQIPISTANFELPLGAIADVERVRDETDILVNYQGKPSIMFSVTKKENANSLELVADLNQLTAQQNALLEPLGLKLEVVDDQTEMTESAITIMQNNFLIGLGLVLLVTFLFLGTRFALFTTLSIPFSLAGVFILLSAIDFTLNTSVLIAVVIALGMLVDDAVVIVESIYYKLRQGLATMDAVIIGVKEVFAPVTTSVLTTTSAFLPLMLMPGILGKFMLVVPFVVCSALLISLLEAFWLLPSHLQGTKISLDKPNRIQRIRNWGLNRLEYFYGKVLLKFLKYPLMSVMLLLVIASTALYAPINGLIKVNFFASDTMRIFYVNVFMPAGTPVSVTLEKTLEAERIVREHLEEDEFRSIVSYSGNIFTETEPFVGQQYGQVLVSLHSRQHAQNLGKIAREVNDIVDPIREQIATIVGPDKVSILTLSGGPPSSKPISMKFLGNNLDVIYAAVEDMKSYLQTMPAIFDITDDAVPGSQSLNLHMKYANLREYGLQPLQVTNFISSLIDGIFITTVSIENENVDIRLLSADSQPLQQGNSINSLANRLLNTQMAIPNGNLVTLANLVEAEIINTRSLIRHYNFNRSISLEADLDKQQMDTVSMNQIIADHWETIRTKHPNVQIDFSGELDDIQESLDSLMVLFVFGIGLVYLLLGTQFASFFRPLLILCAIPMGFVGVIFSLWISGYPLSLFTLYGVVALSGISVNASIVMIAVASNYEKLGMSRAKAIFYAAKRRITPILITTLTTVAGLLSLALGLGGKSLIWGPVASAIAFGLLASSTLTVLFLPAIFALSPTTFVRNLLRKRRFSSAQRCR